MAPSVSPDSALFMTSTSKIQINATSPRPKPRDPRVCHQQRDRLLAQYQLLVRPIALHYAGRCPEPLEDLVQVGMLGLLRAAERFETTQQTPFPAFARPHIRGAILHHLRDGAWAVRLPRRQAERHDQLQQVLKRWGSTHADGPSPKAIQGALGMAESQWQLLEQWRSLRHPVSLDLLPVEAPGAQPMPSDGWTLNRSVDELLEPLDQRQQQVLRMVVLAGWSYRRTALALKVSAPTVQRLLHRGLARLRTELEKPAFSLSPVGAGNPVRSAAAGW